MTLFISSLVALSSIFCAGLAMGYVGPGMAGGVVGIVIGFIFALVLSIFALVYYPVKRLIKRKRSKVKVQSDKKNGS